MALHRTEHQSSTTADFELHDADRFAGYDARPERSHFGAFLMGGVVVAGGLLAFLYYDTENLSGRPYNEFATSGIGRADMPVMLPSVKRPPAGPQATEQK